MWQTAATSGQHPPICREAKLRAELSGAFFRFRSYQVVSCDESSLSILHKQGEVVLHHKHEGGGQVIRLKWGADDDASEDERIDGLYLKMGGVSGGWGQLQELRSALTDFREAGKPCVAYAESWSNGS